MIPLLSCRAALDAQSPPHNETRSCLHRFTRNSTLPEVQAQTGAAPKDKAAARVAA